MNIRSGHRPRDPMARPTDPADSPVVGAGAYDGSLTSTAGAPRGLARGTRRPRAELLRFLIFLFVMAGLVLAGLITVGRPLLRAAVVGFAENSRPMLQVGVVDSLVREDIGPQLTQPPSTDASNVLFQVVDEDTPASVLPKLTDDGLVASPRAFLYFATMHDLGSHLKAGTYLLHRNMSPEQVVQGLVDNRVTVQTIDITFREGLRLEQITAKLQTIPGTSIDPKAFYDIVTKPPDSLVAAYPWLKDPKIRPAGATLEGFLYPATYKVRIDPLKPTDAMGLVRMMLDEFVQQVGTDRMKVPKERGMTFQQVLTLASIVEREAALDEERPLIAGVYENRLDPKKWTTRLLQSDPTVFYVNDTLQLEAMPFGQWKTYVFWAALTGQLPATLPPAVAGYNTYTHRGLPPGPICTPTADSIDAALNPDTKTGYLFFLALPDGSGKSVFARTQAEHERNVAKYGTN